MEDDDQLWQQYVDSRAPDLRHQLILRHMPLVRYLISRMRINLPPFVDRDDIFAYGIIGLIHAIDRFDPTKGVGFPTFARERIRGAVMDALRSCGGLSRTAVAKARHLDGKVAELQQRLGHQPSQAEVAAALGITVESLNELMQEVQISVISLDTPLAEVQERNLGVAAMLEDRRNPSPEEFTLAAETRRVVRAALQQLPARDRQVLDLYYGDNGGEPTLRDVAETLGVSAARVYQLRMRAILRLRQTLRSTRDGTAVMYEGSKRHQVCEAVAGKR